MVDTEDILGALERWKFRESLPQDAHKKVVAEEVTYRGNLRHNLRLQIQLGFIMMMQVQLMCSYCKKHDDTEVPDPYYGGPQGFEKVKLLFLS